jgi:hypothetical protein
MWGCYNCNLYLYQYMCSNNYNLPGNIYSAGTASYIINLSGKYQYSCLLNTSTGKYCVQCMVSDCIGKWWM